MITTTEASAIHMLIVEDLNTLTGQVAVLAPEDGAEYERESQIVHSEEFGVDPIEAIRVEAYNRNINPRYRALMAEMAARNAGVMLRNLVVHNSSVAELEPYQAQRNYLRAILAGAAVEGAALCISMQDKHPVGHKSAPGTATGPQESFRLTLRVPVPGGVAAA